MWTKITWLYVCAALTAAAVDDDVKPHCIDPARCTYIPGYAVGWHEFKLEDNSFFIIYEDGKKLDVDCRSWAALNSTALPAFSSVIHVPNIILRNCPPPAAGGTYAQLLSNLNVTLLRSTTQGSLTLYSLLPHPPLQAQHFAGLEDLFELQIFGWNSNEAAPLPGFLSTLNNLRKLLVWGGLKLPRGELDHLPTSLHSLTLKSRSILALFNHQDQTPMVDNVITIKVSPTMQHLFLESENTTIDLKSIYELETLKLEKWSETRPEALEHCDKLRELRLWSPAVEVLPEGWVARCPRLEHLFISKATHLVSLSSNVLKKATALRHLTLSKGILETLPAGLLDDVPNLITLDLWDNKLRTLPSGLFARQSALQTLELMHNHLDAEAVGALAGLHSLEKLDLGHNLYLTDLCDHSGYSQLLHLQKLKSLDLSDTRITRICRDWRENMTHLSVLDLKKTSISELGFADLMYIRDNSSYAYVQLQGAPVTLVQFSEEDYNASLVAPLSGAEVNLDGKPRLQCDSRMYWARRAVFPTKPDYVWTSTSASVRVRGLHCRDGRWLCDVLPAELKNGV